MMFEAEARHEGPTATVRLTGDLDATADAALSAAHDDAIALAPDVLVVDFSDVGYINSSGIALIVTLLTEARQAGRRVVARALTPHYRHIFEITRLSDYMDLDGDATPDHAHAVREEAAHG